MTTSYTSTGASSPKTSFRAWVSNPMMIRSPTTVTGTPFWPESSIISAAAFASSETSISVKGIFLLSRYAFTMRQ
jgi:hypothetical protein